MLAKRATRNIHVQARGRVRQGIHVRMESNAAPNSTRSYGSPSSHVMAGVAGGAVVCMAGYSYYHFSGTKKVIDGARAMKASFLETKDRMISQAPSSNAILNYMRSTAKTYAGFIPGASGYVDETFDSLDSLADKHSEELDRILKDTYEELTPIVQNGTANAETASRVLQVFRKFSSRISDLSQAASGDLLKPLFERYPELKEKLGGSYQQLVDLSSSAGPEAKRILVTTTLKLKSALEQGSNTDSIRRATEALQDASQQVQEIASKTGSNAKEAWNKSKEQAQPYLDNLPDIKELLDEKASALMKNRKGAEAIWKRLQDVGKGKRIDKQKVEELKSMINETAEGSQDSSTSLLGQLEALTKNSPVAENLQDFVVVLKDDTDEAKQLAEETTGEIMKVLKSKADKAKEIAKKAKKDIQEKKE